MTDNARGIEQFKAQLQIEIKRFEADLASRQAVWEEQQVRDREAWIHERRTLQSMFKAIVDYSLVAIRSLILVNGGAIIGIISFTSNLWSRGSTSAAAMAKAIAPAVAWFVAGLTLALLTAGLAFVAQVIFAEMRRPQPAIKIGNTVRAIAVALALASLCAFVVGAYEGLSAFRSPIP